MLAPTDSGKTYAVILVVIDWFVCSGRAADGAPIEAVCLLKVRGFNEEEVGETIVRIHMDDSAEVKSRCAKI